MSLLGKILAILNVLGAIGFGALAALDYGKRQSWEYVNLQHDLNIVGLPLTDGEKDPSTGRSRDLTEQAKKDIFGGQNPVSSQVAEVKRVKALLDSKLSAGDPRAQTVGFAAVLEPLADTDADRERLQAVRKHLGDDKSAAQLHDDLLAAYKAATDRKRPQPQGKKFEEAFAEEVFARRGEPKQPFEEALLAAFKAKPGQPFDDAYNAALESVRAGLQARYEAAFREAAQGERTGSEGAPAAKLAPGEQRAAVARLLVGLAETVAQAEGGQAPPAFDLAAPPYKRVVAVVGLQAALREVERETGVLTRMLADLGIEAQREAALFGAANARLAEDARDRAARVARLTDLVSDRQQQLARQRELASQSAARVEEFTKDLKDERERTAEDLKKLRELSTELYKYRVAGRDAAATNQKHEQEIRGLEEKRR